MTPRRVPAARRAFGAVALVGLLALSLAGCGGLEELRPYAALVDGTRIERSQVDDDVQTLAANTSLGVEVTPEITSRWLSILVTRELVRQEFERRSLKPADEAKATQSAQAFFGGPEAFDAFPAGFRTSVVDDYRRRDALNAELGSPEVTDELVRTSYDAVVARGCTSGRTLEYLQMTDAASAAAVIDQIKGGTDLADLAADNNGGVIPCYESQPGVAGLDDAVRNAALGEVAEPLDLGGGQPVIVYRVTAFPPSFEALEPTLRAGLEQQAQQDPVSLALSQLQAGADVKIDPRYGTWDPTGTVTPPTIPAVADGRGTGTP